METLFMRVEFMSRAAVAMAAAGAFSTTLLADAPPVPEATLIVNGEAHSVAIVAAPAPLGGFTYDATVTDAEGEWKLVVDLLADPDPAQTALISGLVHFTNTAMRTQDVEFIFDLPLCPMVVGEASISGSVIVKLTMDTGGGELECLSGDTLWSARLQNLSSQDLYPGLFTLSGTGKGTAATSSTFGIPLAKKITLDESTNFGLRQKFSVTSGDTVKFTNMFIVTAEADNFVECEALEGDLNGDGAIDAADLGLLLGKWEQVDDAADINDDGIVDAADLGLLIGAWS
jgi:hypothetical protein